MNTLFINIGAGEAFFMFLFLIVSLTPLIFAVSALIDLFKREFRHKSTDKVLLIVLIVLAPFVGSIVYYFFLRNNYPLKHRTF